MTITDAPLDVIPPVGLLIGDGRVDQTSGGWHRHVYAATGQPTVDVPLAGEKEITEAVRAAGAALDGWRSTTPDRRRDLLLRLADLVVEDAERLARLQTVENAIPHQFTAAMPKAAADFLRYNAGWADKLGGGVVPAWPARALDYTVDEPYGVVAIIIPWNGGVVSMGQMLGPALAAGNTVVVKPSELAPFTALRMGGLALLAGLPPGVVNVVAGGPDGGEALVRHPGVDKVHFTGSTATGRKILESALVNLTPVGLELGGKSAHLIFADGDLRIAARQALTGAVALNGQGCANGTRILVQAPVYDEVLRIALGRLKHVAVGDPLVERTVMGPVVSQAACDRIMRVIDTARERGHGRLVAGGQRLDGELADGYFIAPTVFSDVDNGSDLAQQEIFGPVLSFLRFDTEEEAVRLANDTRYGLAAYVHTNDLRRAHRVARALEVGNVWVNGFPGLSPSVPFGGVKQSGYGRIGGAAGVREFLRPKNVWVAA
jgi:acyl-CoA reductase-like NAD-dependent aldehyde dehydrogenase